MTLPNVPLRRRKRLLWRLLAGLVSLLVIALVGGFLWLRTSLPKTSGTVTVAGLVAPVEIRRDGDGIVIIRAEDESDAAFALGYAHAQDRLFQMELMRRVGAGRLSEVMGARTLPVDKLMRTLGLYRLAEANFPLLAPEVRQQLDSYAAGVNAFLNMRTGALPPEFVLLRHSPEPWRPADSLVWGRLMAWQLSSNWREEVTRFALSRQLTPAQLESFWPERGGTKGAYGRAAYLNEDASPALPWLGSLSTASNNWVVGGTRTISGKPLLANDPHLGFGAPIQWYLARIETPTLTLVGATAPGLPALVIGHNGRVAWGFTTTAGDTQDLFVERLAGPDAYQTPAGPQSFARRTETIKVAGEADVVLTVRETRHGPVMSDIGIAEEVAGPNEVVALSWAGSRPEDLTAQALYRFNHARTAAEMRAALADFHSPEQNVVYADVEGSIGFMAAGLVPVRKALSAAGQMPAEGWTGAYDWTGFLPVDQLPRSQDPPEGWLGTANHKIVADDYPHFIAARWEYPYRARRIGELIEAQPRHDLDSMARMQMDRLSPAARDLLPVLLAAMDEAQSTDGPAQQTALALLRLWDFDTARDRPEPLIFTAWLRELGAAVYRDELGPLFDQAWFWDAAGLRHVLTSTDPMDRDVLGFDPAERHWCNDVDMPIAKSCPERIAIAFDRAIQILSQAYGPDPRSWRWGEAHAATFPNAVLQYLPILRDWAGVTVATDGDNFTLNRGTPDILPGSPLFPHIHGAGLRAVFDLADLDRSRFVIASGQSGNPLSPHYTDFVERWRDGGYVTIVARDSDEILTLQPRQP